MNGAKSLFLEKLPTSWCYQGSCSYWRSTSTSGYHHFSLSCERAWDLALRLYTLREFHVRFVELFFSGIHRIHPGGNYQFSYYSGVACECSVHNVELKRQYHGLCRICKVENYLDCFCFNRVHSIILPFSIYVNFSVKSMNLSTSENQTCVNFISHSAISAFSYHSFASSLSKK